MEMNSAAESRKYNLRWKTLTVLALSLMLIGLDNTILNVAIPTLQREFSASASQLQWMVDSYILVFAGLLLAMGGLGDRFGRAKLLRIGLVIFGAAALGASFATTSGQIVAARALMGIGGAMIMPSTLSIIIDVFKGPERARAISIWTATAGVGIGLGPLIGGLLIEYLSWNWVFLVNLPIVAVALLAGWWLIPESKDPEPKPIDFVGAGLSTAAIAALIVAIIEAPARGWGSPLILGGFAATAVLIGLFAFREMTTKYPLLDFSVFRNRRFSLGAGSISIASFGLMGLVFGFTQYMQFVQGYSALEAGVRLLPLAAGIAIGARGGEKLNSRFGTRAVVTSALVLLALTFGSINFVFEVDSAYWLIGLAVFLISAAMGSIMAPSTNAVMGAIPEHKAGVGSAMNDVTRQVGGAFGIAIIGSILNSIYSSRIASTVESIAVLPLRAAEASIDSVGAALRTAASLPPADAALLAGEARTAFTDAFGLAVLVGAGVALLGAALVLRFMPEAETHEMESVSVTAAADGTVGVATD
ncbi:MAG: MFS transporter [Chloroflexi bacterium]|nr:MFS transporter [Chloroflexota bacterium]